MKPIPLSVWVRYVEGKDPTKPQVLGGTARRLRNREHSLKRVAGVMCVVRLPKNQRVPRVVAFTQAEGYKHVVETLKPTVKVEKPICKKEEDTSNLDGRYHQILLDIAEIRTMVEVIPARIEARLANKPYKTKLAWWKRIFCRRG